MPGTIGNACPRCTALLSLDSAKDYSLDMRSVAARGVSKAKPRLGRGHDFKFQGLVLRSVYRSVWNRQSLLKELAAGHLEF